MFTNRDLYLAIVGLGEQHAESERSLEQYLLALHAGLAQHAHDRLSGPAFLEILETAWVAHVPAMPIEWRSAATDPRELVGFAACEASLKQQIVDLREMAEQGALDNKLKEFGIDSPRGHRWFNFRPSTYLECACAGSFAGWREGDDSGRFYVPGECVYLDADGELECADPRDIPNPITDLSSVTWEQVDQFLWAGQYYE